MALPNLPDIKQIELQYLDLWFANIVDTINYDLGKIEAEVPTLVNQLTNVDTAPIHYLKDSLDELVKDINDGFTQIKDTLRSFESRLEALEAKGG